MTRRRVGDEQYASLWRRVDELIRRVDEGTIPYEFAMLQIQRTIQTGDSFARDEFRAQVFGHWETQIRRVRLWNWQMDWGFSSVDIEKVRHPPAWKGERDSPLMTEVLVPYLETVWQTFEALWHLACSQQRGGSYTPRISPESLELSSGIRHVPGLRWEVIDLGNRAVLKQDRVAVPHAGILAAAAHFPQWVRLMNGSYIPFVWLSGYRAYGNKGTKDEETLSLKLECDSLEEVVIRCSNRDKEWNKRVATPAWKVPFGDYLSHAEK